MTVLHRLKKVKHPVVYEDWKRQKLLGDFYYPKSKVLANSRCTYCTHNDKDTVFVEMGFHPSNTMFTTNQTFYKFHIQKDSFTVMIIKHLVEDLAFSEERVPLSLVDIPYNNLEEMYFQQLTVQENFGMIGLQELEMIKQIRDIYFKE
ncbi:hypothetical protein ACRYKS_20010 [Escherichia coli]|uniref:Uncharacterized protein n=1 Tax=Escherichia phage fEgEco12 TaxID=3158837 RepID=A0AAU7PHR7_9CAUD|nr:hypothetical protein [Escherichia coli]ELW0836363.1 hypothetical protein [Escherichia coli]HCJ9509821.1 hypothetical protein [Escherichia coli]